MKGALTTRRNEIKQTRVNLPWSSRINNREQLALHILDSFIRHHTQLSCKHPSLGYEMLCGIYFPMDEVREDEPPRENLSRVVLGKMLSKSDFLICHEQVRTGHSSHFSYFTIQIKASAFWSKLVKPQSDWNVLELCGPRNMWRNEFNFCSASCDWIISSTYKLSLNFVFQIQ